MTHPRAVGAGNAQPQQRVATRLTGSGVLLFVTSLLLAASAFKALRVEIAGLQVHLYLFPLVPFFLLAGVQRLGRVPRRAIVGGLVFLAMFSIASMRGQGALGEIMKLAASLLTLIAAATLVRSRADFLATTLGMAAAVGIMALHGFATSTGSLEGINPLSEVSNKNAYSLYAIPAVMLAVWVIAHERGTVLRIALAACSLLTVLAVFSSANRSGWLGLVLVGAMITLYEPRRRNWKTILVVAVLAGIAYYLHATFGETEVVRHRWEQTVQGYTSDELREELFVESVKIAIENPLFGATRIGLGTELVRRLQIWELVATDPHNVVAFLLGATGFLTFFAFLYFGWTMWRQRPRAPGKLESQALVRMLLILLLVRGMFTHEVLYSPAFAIAIGAAIGLTAAEHQREAAQRAA